MQEIKVVLYIHEQENVIKLFYYYSSQIFHDTLAETTMSHCHLLQCVK